MVNIAICNDKNIVVNSLEKMLENICSERLILCEVDIFYSIKILDKQISNGKRYDIIFYSNQKLIGDEIIAWKNIRNFDEEVLLVYILENNNYLNEFIHFNIFDCIDISILAERFEQVFLNAYNQICSKKVYFTFEYKKEEYKILTDNILYFESRGRQIFVYLLDGGTHYFYSKLSDVERRLANGKITFLRIHQSYLVNFHHVLSRANDHIEMINHRKLPISEDRRKIFKKQYMKLLENIEYM